MSTNMFGKTYNTVGSSDSNFIIKTKGDLKVQWGNKYIDIIKNGKLASAKSSFFKEVESEDLISDNGIYLVEDQIWISIGGTKINISNISTEDKYISFIQEQPEITADQKYVSLSNVGFYYDSLESAKRANLTKGLIYIEKEHLLYYINNGIITKYVGTIPDTINKFKEIYIESLRIFQDFAQLTFDSDIPLIFKIKKLPIIQINKDSVEINQTMNIHGNIIGDNYKIYSKNGQSYLEVDNIVSKSEESDKQQEAPLEWIYAENVINAQSIEGSIITCKTIYKNTYKDNDSIYLLMDNSATLSYTNSTYYLSYPVPIDIVLKAGEQIITIPKNTTELTTDQGSENYEIIQGTEYLNTDSYKNKLGLWKFVVNNSTETEFTITLPVEDPSFIDRCQYISTCLANKPLLTINNEIKYSENDKVRTIIGDISKIKLPKKKEELTHGIFSENLISANGQFYDALFKKIQEYPKYDSLVELPENIKDSKYDLVIPNLQWVKSLINNLFPIGSIIMFNGIIIPDGWAICDGNNGTPNLIGRFIKAGTKSEIIQSQLNENNELILTKDNLPNHSHPHELHAHTFKISNIQGNTSISATDVTSNNTFAYQIQNTSVEVVTGVTVTSPTEKLEVGLTTGQVINSINPTYQKVESAGTHYHTVAFTEGEVNTNLTQSVEKSQQFVNTPIKIEPRAYSLIFIMKIK